MPDKPGIIRTDAVVLRSMEYGETSRINTLFTLEQGKMAVIARGARSSRSRFGSTLDPMAHIEAIIYIKPTRELQTITDASHVRAYPGIREYLDRIEIGLKALELTNALLPDGLENRELFSLLVEVLSTLNEPYDRVRNLSPFFQLRLASILGFSPSFEKREVEELTDAGGILEMQSGAIFSSTGSHVGERTASRSSLRAFAIFARAPIHKVLQLALRPETESEVADMITSYMRYHFEDSYPDRTARVFAQLELG